MVWVHAHAGRKSVGSSAAGGPDDLLEMGSVICILCKEVSRISVSLGIMPYLRRWLMIDSKYAIEFETLHWRPGIPPLQKGSGRILSWISSKLSADTTYNAKIPSELNDTYSHQCRISDIEAILERHNWKASTRFVSFLEHTSILPASKFEFIFSPDLCCVIFWCRDCAEMGLSSIQNRNSCKSYTSLNGYSDILLGFTSQMYLPRSFRGSLTISWGSKGDSTEQPLFHQELSLLNEDVMHYSVKHMLAGWNGKCIIQLPPQNFQSFLFNFEYSGQLWIVMLLRGESSQERLALPRPCTLEGKLILILWAISAAERVTSFPDMYLVSNLLLDLQMSFTLQYSFQTNMWVLRSLVVPVFSPLEDMLWRS